MISGLAKFAGGLETVVNELAESLTSRGHQVTVYGRYKEDFVEQNGLLRTVGVCPSELLPRRLRFAHYDKYAYNLKVWKKTLRDGSFDVIHGHGDNCFFSALLRDTTPLIATFHLTQIGCFHVLHEQKIGPRAFPVFIPEMTAAHRSDIVVACSKAVKGELVGGYKVNPNKVRLIYNGVNTKVFRPLDKQHARKALGLPLDKRYLLWVGTNPKPKRLNTAIETAKSMDNTCLLIAGVPGVTRGCTVYFGQINDSSRMRVLYSAADVLVFPTAYEGFGLTAIESMACGTPAIVSRFAPVTELFERSLATLVATSLDAAEYREKANWLLSDRSSYEALSVEGRKLAERLTWERQAREYWKLYESLT